MCLPSNFTHAKNSSNMHRKERSKYTHHDKCSQCHQPVSEDTKVAAHVVAYPCFNPCCGLLTLKTTCKKCNNTHNAESSEGKSFIGGLFKHNPFITCICWPSCSNYNLE